MREDLGRGLATMELTLSSVSSASVGTLTTAVLNVAGSVHACGARRTTHTGSALTFKQKTGNMQNVQTAKEHILLGLKPVQPS